MVVRVVFNVAVSVAVSAVIRIVFRAACRVIAILLSLSFVREMGSVLNDRRLNALWPGRWR